MIFGKAINRYYLKHAPVLLLGILSLLTVDYIQLLIPELYRLVINGVNLGQVVVGGQPLHAEADACIRGNKRKAPCRTYRQGAFSGARYRTRTCDLLHVKQMLYQLS